MGTRLVAFADHRSDRLPGLCADQLVTLRKKTNACGAPTPSGLIGSSDCEEKSPNMLPINRWWESTSAEAFWLEVTRGHDLGPNLKAPQADEQRHEYWSYSLIKEIKHGDIVFHYDGTVQGIVARSVAMGIVWEDEIMWAARGLSARSAHIMPHLRAGWYLGLERFERLATPLGLDQIREKATDVRALVGSLNANFRKPLYFPFELGNRPIRPMQGHARIPLQAAARFCRTVRDDAKRTGADPC